MPGSPAGGSSSPGSWQDGTSSPAGPAGSTFLSSISSCIIYRSARLIKRTSASTWAPIYSACRPSGSLDEARHVQHRRGCLKQALLSFWIPLFRVFLVFPSGRDCANLGALAGSPVGCKRDGDSLCVSEALLSLSQKNTLCLPASLVRNEKIASVP